MSSKTAYDNAEVTKIFKGLRQSFSELTGKSPILKSPLAESPPQTSEADILSMCRSYWSIKPTLNGGVVGTLGSNNSPTKPNDLPSYSPIASTHPNGKITRIPSEDVHSATKQFNRPLALEDGIVPDVNPPLSPKKRRREKEKTKESNIVSKRKQSSSSKRSTDEPVKKKHKPDLKDRDKDRERAHTVKEKSAEKERERNPLLVIRLPSAPDVADSSPVGSTTTPLRSKPTSKVITSLRSKQAQRDTKEEKQRQSKRELKRDSASGGKSIEKDRSREKDRDVDRRRERDSKRSKRDSSRKDKEKSNEKERRRSVSIKDNHGFDLTPSASEDEDDIRERERQARKERRRSDPAKKTSSSRKDERRKSKSSISSKIPKSAPKEPLEFEESAKPLRSSRRPADDEKERRGDSKRERTRDRDTERRGRDGDKDRNEKHENEKERKGDKDHPGEKSPQGISSRKPLVSGTRSTGIVSKPVEAATGSAAASSAHTQSSSTNGDCDGKMPRVVTRADRATINFERGKLEQRFRKEKERCIELFKNKKYDAYEESAKMALQLCFRWSLSHETSLRLQDQEIKQMPIDKRSKVKKSAVEFYRYMSLKFIKERIEELESINRHQTVKYFQRARSKSYLRMFALQRVWEKEQRSSDDSTLSYAAKILQERENERNADSKIEVSTAKFNQLNRMAKDYTNIVSIMHDVVNEKQGYEDAGLECSVQ